MQQWLLTDINLPRAAAAYARLGWRILPLEPQGKRPIQGFGGYGEATNDPQKVERLWNRHPEANIGGIPASVGCLVVDLDGAEASEPALRLGLLAEPTLMVRTGREGGVHLYFQHPGGQPIGNRVLAPGIDIRADSGYVVLPPSIHKSGRRYVGEFDWIEPCQLPTALLEQLRRPRHQIVRSSPRYPRYQAKRRRATNAIAEGARNCSLFGLACGWRNGGLSEEHILSRLRRVNDQRCRPPLSQTDLVTIARSAARYPSRGSHTYDRVRETAR